MPSPNQNPEPSRRSSQSKAQEQLENISLPSLGLAYDPLQNGPDTPHYYQTIFQVFRDVDNNRPFIVNATGKALLQHLEMFEWNLPYPEWLTPRQVPFFRSDQRVHDQLAQAYVDYGDLAKLTPKDSQRLHRRARGRVRGSEQSEDVMFRLEQLQGRIDGLHGQLHKRHAHYDVFVGDGYVRFTPFGRAIRDALVKMSPDNGLLLLKIILRTEQLDPNAKMQWRRVLEHGVKLAKLSNPELHLRKLNIGVLQKNINLMGENLERRFKQVEAEHYTDIFLQAPKSHAGEKALRWLNTSNGGNYCPPPYPSWQAAQKSECQEESKRIVVRAKLHSYTAFQKLRMETRHLGGQDPLLYRFARENFEQVMFAHGSNIDMPPGRGVFMAGPRLEKLYHGDPVNSDDALVNHREARAAWWEPALPLFENTSAIFLRGWFAVLNPSPEFTLFGTRYAIVVDNNHFSDLYGSAFGIPESIITKKIAPTLHRVEGKPTKRTKDLTHQDASVSGLIEATIAAGHPPLVLGTMSQLFGGMVNALPVGYSPTLQWEQERQSGIWKDAYNHVHWSWLVWSIRDKRPKVDSMVAPMSEADEAVRKFAIRGQQLIEITLDRYASWKNDQTPGEKGSPLMLREAYALHKAFKRGHPSMPKDENVYIGIYDRTAPGGKPAPVINCRTLEIMRKNGNIQLPTWSDGTENQEAMVWREYIKPLLLVTDKHGIAREGEYELAIIGDKDL